MSKLLALTVEEKVLLHLLDLSGQVDHVVRSPEVTQTGIAKAVGIERKHVPRVIRALVERGAVVESLSHVGTGRRQMTYALTWRGLSRAREIWKNVSSREIFVTFEDGRSGVAPLSKLCFILQFSRRPLSVILEVSESLEYRFSGSEALAQDPEDALIDSRAPAPESPPPGDGTFREGEDVDDVRRLKERLYTGALVQAWKDGRLSLDEQEMLREMRHILGISSGEHDRLEKLITLDTGRKEGHEGVDASTVYKATLEETLRDGVITRDEDAILRRLRKLLSITQEEHTDIAADIRSRSGQDPLSENETIYREALSQALVDGVITRDESDILRRLRGILEISEERDRIIRRSLIV